MVNTLAGLAEVVGKSAGQLWWVIKPGSQIAHMKQMDQGAGEELVGEMKGHRERELGSSQLIITEMSQKSCPRGPQR